MKEVKNFSRKKIKKIKNLLEYSDQHNDKKMLKRFIVACKILYVQQALTTVLTKHSIFPHFHIHLHCWFYTKTSFTKFMF